MLNMHKGDVKNLKPMIKQRHKHSSLSVGRWVVAFGGSRRANSIEMLDMDYGEFWYEVRP